LLLAQLFPGLFSHVDREAMPTDEKPGDEKSQDNHGQHPHQPTWRSKYAGTVQYRDSHDCDADDDINDNRLREFFIRVDAGEQTSAPEKQDESDKEQ